MLANERNSRVIEKNGEFEQFCKDFCSSNIIVPPVTNISVDDRTIPEATADEIISTVKDRKQGKPQEMLCS